MKRRQLIVMLAALPLIAAGRAFAEPTTDPRKPTPRPVRETDNGPRPSHEDRERERIEEYHRRRREYLAAVARMA